MAPDPRRRSGTPEHLRRAVLGSRPASSNGRRWRRPVTALAAVALIGALPVGARLGRPPLPDYPMVRIEGGRADGPEVSEPVAPFLLGRTEVTQALWEAVTGTPLATRRLLEADTLGLPCATWNGVSLEGPDLPMVCVDFVEAVRFADALSAREGLAPAHRVSRGADGAWTIERVSGAGGYRLPTLAEWRLAITPGPGQEPAPENNADQSLKRLRPLAAVDEIDDGFATLSPVGSFPPGPRGVQDGHGNVNEWLWDPGGPGLRWIAGGQWSTQRSAFALGYAAPGSIALREVTLGLRLARDPL